MRKNAVEFFLFLKTLFSMMSCVCRWGIWWTKLARWDYVAPVPHNLNNSGCAHQFKQKSLGVVTARSLVWGNDIPDLERATLSSMKKLSVALSRSEISLRETRDLAVTTPRFWAMDEARGLHAVGFSPLSQFEQCHRYVLRAACLWLDRVKTIILSYTYYHWYMNRMWRRNLLSGN